MALLFCRGPADLQSHKKNLEEEESVVHEVEASAESTRGCGPLACRRGPAGSAERLWCRISSCRYAGESDWPRVTRPERQLRRAFDEQPFHERSGHADQWAGRYHHGPGYAGQRRLL